MQGPPPLIDEIVGSPCDGSDNDVTSACLDRAPVGRVAGGRKNAAELAQHRQRIFLGAMG